MLYFVVCIDEVPDNDNKSITVVAHKLTEEQNSKLSKGDCVTTKNNKEKVEIKAYKYVRMSAVTVNVKRVKHVTAIIEYEDGSKSKVREPPRGKTNNVVSEQVRHEPACTSTEKN